MNKNSIIKYLVPVVAVIVVAESVILISRINNKPGTEGQVVNKDNRQSETVKKESDVYTIKIESQTLNLKKGATGVVKVGMVGNVNKAVDSINLYVKYDPSKVEAMDMTFDKKLPTPVFSKVSTLRGLLVANFLISDADGLSILSGEELNLMTFKVKALKPGKVDFEISTGKEMKESATMIVENGTSKSVGFSSNKLTINVTE